MNTASEIFQRIDNTRNIKGHLHSMSNMLRGDQRRQQIRCLLLKELIGDAERRRQVLDTLKTFVPRLLDRVLYTDIIRDLLVIADSDAFIADEYLECVDTIRLATDQEQTWTEPLTDSTPPVDIDLYDNLYDQLDTLEYLENIELYLYDKFNPPSFSHKPLLIVSGLYCFLLSLFK